MKLRTFFSKRKHNFIINRIKQFEKKNNVDILNEIYHKDLNFDWKKGNFYRSTMPHELKKVLKKMPITKNDSFIDFGSGKGTSLIVASKFRFNKICGVELSDNLHKIAKTNMRNLSLNNIKLINIDALEVKELLDDYNYFYFYNPFPENIFVKVLHSINESLERKKRSSIIFYGNPYFDGNNFNRTILENTKFEKIKEFSFAKPIFVYKYIQ